MHKTTFTGPTDRIIPTPSDIINHEEADIDLDGWVVVESQDFPNEAKYLSGTIFVLFPILQLSFYQSPLILPALLHVDLIKVIYLTACAFIRSS